MFKFVYLKYKEISVNHNEKGRGEKKKKLWKKCKPTNKIQDT